MQHGMPQTQHPRMQAPSQANAAFQDSRQQQNLLWPQQSQQQQPDQRPPHGGADMSLGRLQRAAGAIGVMQAAAKGTGAMRGAAQDASEAGVGMVFKALPERPDEAVVQELVQGGSAMREGSVQIGDILLQVDGEDMLADMSKIRRAILGEIGTFVTMQFLRRTSDGDFEYTLSLLRGSAMYFDQLTQKSRLQGEVDRMRQTMRIVEEDRQNLHTQLEKLEAQSGKEKAELSELRRQLGVAEETLRAEQSALKREQEERMQEEQRLGSVRDQKDQDRRNLEQLRGWLDQAQDKLSGAHESLQATRQHKAEMENRLQQESKTRAEVEEIERQLISEMESKMEEDRKFREDREQELLALEEERRKYERLVSETEVSIDDEVRRRRVLETRNAKVELQHKKVEEDNERLQMMLKEAEEARTTIEQAKADAEAKNAKIEEELLSIDEQSAKRQEYIEELKQKLESERLRLEQELRTQQDGRKTDATNFKQKEEDQMAVIAKASEDVRLVKEDQEEKRRKFETNITRLDQEVKSFEAALKAEESLSEALRERCSVLNEQLEMIDEELKASNEELRALHDKLKQSEEDKLRALERERAMSMELQKATDDEVEKLNAIEDMRKQFDEERRSKEMQMHEATANQRKLMVEKEEAEHNLRRCRDDGQLMVDNERRRIERELQFKNSHSECISQYESTVKTQDAMIKAVGDIKIPLAQFAKYAGESGIFSDTDPKQPRALDAPAQFPEQMPQMVQSMHGMRIPFQGERIGNLSASMHAYQGGMVSRDQMILPAREQVLVHPSYTSQLAGPVNGYANGHVNASTNGSYHSGYSGGNYSLGASMNAMQFASRDQANGQ